MLTKEQVRHIAFLARIGVSEEEIGKFLKELSSILDFVAKLKEADTEGVAPTSHVIDIANVMRPDEAVHHPEIAGELLRMAPDTKDGYVKVRAVL